jgi:hypothetical protein
VRRTPNPKAIPIVADLYKTMLNAERQAGAKNAMTASGDVLNKVLQEKGVTYDELINVLQAL